MECFKDFRIAFQRFSIKNLIDLLNNALTLTVFELEKCSFFSNWYHHQGTSPAPLGTIQHRKSRKTTMSKVLGQSPVPYLI